MSALQKFAVIGGDLRQLVAAREIAGRGFPTVICGFDIYEGDYGNITRAGSTAEAVADAAYILLPLPYSYDGARLHCPLTKEEILVCDIQKKASPTAVLFAGKAAGLRDSRAVDYHEREEFSVLNAIPTAEGALALVMAELPITVHGMQVAVTGFGRIGKTVSRLFAAAGAEVTVFARSYGALAWAKTYGCNGEHMELLSQMAGRFDCIINTVPAVVMDRAVLASTKGNVLVVDLASKPGGVDIAAAERLGRRHICALSLPGKTSPDTAGKIISETILNILCEKGVEIK